jgi:hypothetical protein
MTKQVTKPVRTALSVADRDSVYRGYLWSAIDTYHWECLLRFYSRWDTRLRFLILITTSGSAVASLAVWRQYPLAWQFVLFLSACAALVHAVWNPKEATKTLLRASDLHVKVRNALRRLYDDMDIMDPNEVIRISTDLETQVEDIRHSVAHIPMFEFMRYHCQRQIHLELDLPFAPPHVSWPRQLVRSICNA